MNQTKLASSFRDPSGSLFLKEGELLREINKCYKTHYDYLISSGLYNKLTKNNLLIEHKEISNINNDNPDLYKVIKPELIPFISYPYEWSFSQLKDAALATIEIAKIALEHGMILKDGSAYNIQFFNLNPMLIDTLSFEIYKEGTPWVAYKQFCQHFIAPLALMSNKDVRLNQLSQIFIDGIPLDLASKLLPIKTNISPLFFHIHSHLKSQNHIVTKEINEKEIRISKTALMCILDNLESTIKSLILKKSESLWSNYYETNNYTETAIKKKKDVVNSWLEMLKPNKVWDLGSNTGEFSQIASQNAQNVISFDLDPNCIEKSYLEYKNKKCLNILPLVLDLSNPSPGIGWDNNERLTIKERGKTDLVLALALIHHLAISNNVPFFDIAKFFSQICTHLIIEFIPKEDSQIQRMLASRTNIFNNYTKAQFENDFKVFFNIETSESISDSKRVLYLMKNL